MKVPANVIDQLVQSAQSDIRQVLNMLSTWKLSSATMDFDEGKHLYVDKTYVRVGWYLTCSFRSKMYEKYSIQTPFNIINKLMGPYLFSATARETLNDKIELYFHDYSFVPLFVQVSLAVFCTIDL
jgi:replication factor C subunit 1